MLLAASDRINAPSRKRQNYAVIVNTYEINLMM